MSSEGYLEKYIRLNRFVDSIETASEEAIGLLEQKSHWKRKPLFLEEVSLEEFLNKRSSSSSRYKEEFTEIIKKANLGEGVCIVRFITNYRGTALVKSFLLMNNMYNFFKGRRINYCTSYEENNPDNVKLIIAIY